MFVMTEPFKKEFGGLVTVILLSALSGNEIDFVKKSFVR